MEITVAWTTLLKVFLACLLAYLAIRLWPLAELLFLALLISIAFRPLFKWSEKRRWPKWGGVLVAALLPLGSTSWTTPPPGETKTNGSFLIRSSGDQAL